MRDITDELNRLITELDQLAQEAAKSANIDYPSKEEAHPMVEDFYHGASFAYANARDKVGMLLLTLLEGKVSR